MKFTLPIALERLQNNRLKLVPIEQCTDQELQDFITETCVKHPELWHYFPSGPYQSVEEYKAWYDETIRHDPSRALFAIYLKAGKYQKRTAGSDDIVEIEVAENTFAGTTGLINASTTDSVVEIGYVMVVTRFQRTFVNTDTTCLLLKHMLDPIEGGDLNMRRVQWQANSMNKPSIAAAQRFGMTFEGIVRWQKTIGDNKQCASTQPGTRSDGLPVVDRNGRRLGPGRSTAVLSMCWDDWLDGKRDHVLKLLQRE